MRNGLPMPAYYPVSLKISGRKCVVVGGGKVALRKAKALLEYGADVEVISPDICPELVCLADGGKLRTIDREYRTGDLKSAFMAIAATDDGEINRRVAAEARKGGVLVNAVDDAENSDFIVPSCLRRGEVTVAVSTSGLSPALARKIRTGLEKEFGDEYASLIRLIGEVRAELKREGTKVDGDRWQRALDLDRLLDLIHRGDEAAARDTLLSNLKAIKAAN